MLAVPQLLKDLLVCGRWPRNTEEMSRFRVAPERIAKLAPEETFLCLLPPPFQTVRERSKTNPFWTWPMADPGGIDFDLALDIGDFGLGSDAPILLDYRDDPMNPRVLRLWWSPVGKGDNNKWVVMAPDFGTFVNVLGL